MSSISFLVLSIILLIVMLEYPLPLLMDIYLRFIKIWILFEELLNFILTFVSCFRSLLLLALIFNIFLRSILDKLPLFSFKVCLIVLYVLHKLQDLTSSLVITWFCLWNNQNSTEQMQVIFLRHHQDKFSMHKQLWAWERKQEEDY